MKLTVRKEELLHGMKTVQNAVPAKAQYPVLLNVLFQASPKGLRVTATDMDLMIACAVTAEVETVGAMAVPPKKFEKFIRSLSPEALVTLEGVADGEMTVTSSGSRCSLRCLPAEDFPVIPEFNEQVSFWVPVAPLLFVLRRTAFSASTDETRYMLNGVHLTIADKKVKAAATDGARRLAVSSQALESDAPALAAIIPNKAVAAFLHTMGDSEEGQKVQVTVASNLIAFKRGGLIVASRLIEGRYPQYEHAIPKESNIVIEGPKADFTSLVQRATIGAERLAVVSLSLEQNVMRIKSGNGLRIKIENPIPIEYAGAPFSISFNGTYFLDTMKAIAADEVALQFSKPLGPIIIKPTDSEDTFYLIMPFRA